MIKLGYENNHCTYDIINHNKYQLTGQSDKEFLLPKPLQCTKIHQKQHFTLHAIKTPTGGALLTTNFYSYSPDGSSLPHDILVYSMVILSI